MNKSLWISSSQGDRYGELDEDKRVECLIVGGGIVGITTAYLLCKKGYKTTIVDADYIGYGATGRNTGKITPQHGIKYSDIYKRYGRDDAKKYYEANKEALKLIENIIEENKIECDYEKAPAYIYAEDDSDGKKVLNEFNICKEIGINCEFIMDIPLPIKSSGAIKFNVGAQFNPKKYIDALAKKVKELGGEIYEKSPMKSVDAYEDSITVHSLNGYEIKADKLIIASHYPFYDGLSFYFARLKPERSYVVAGEYDGDFPQATFINSSTPKRSLRIYNDGERRFLLIAGEGHKVAHKTEEDHYGALEQYGRDVFGVENYQYRWSTQDYITTDNVPYIGYLNSVTKNILVATGFAKWGMSNGTLAGIILSDLYIKGKSKYLNTLTPSRSDGYLTGEFFKENADVGVQYLIGKLKIASKEMPEKGFGKVVIIDKAKFGVYRDENDIFHIVDTTCTHLGCELKWNPLEKSWDCPCHGSRFGIDGDILEGPATIPLKQYGAETYNEINPNLL